MALLTFSAKNKLRVLHLAVRHYYPGVVNFVRYEWYDQNPARRMWTKIFRTYIGAMSVFIPIKQDWEGNPPDSLSLIFVKKMFDTNRELYIIIDKDGYWRRI